MTGMNIGLENFRALFQPEIFLQWSLGVLYGTLLLFLLRRFSQFLLVPGVILLTVLLTHFFFTGFRSGYQWGA